MVSERTVSIFCLGFRNISPHLDCFRISINLGDLFLLLAPFRSKKAYVLFTSQSVPRRHPKTWSSNGLSSLGKFYYQK